MGESQECRLYGWDWIRIVPMAGSSTAVFNVLGQLPEYQSIKSVYLIQKVIKVL
jgi:hypothetical protein